MEARSLFIIAVLILAALVKASVKNTARRGGRTTGKPIGKNGERMAQAQVSVLRVRIDDDLPRGAARLRARPGQAPERGIVIRSDLVHGGLLACICSIVTHRTPQEKGRFHTPCAKNRRTPKCPSVCHLVDRPAAYCLTRSMRLMMPRGQISAQWPQPTHLS